MRRKQLQKGIDQLAEEGTVQIFTEKGREKDPILGVVGRLQFEVLTYRLEHEYGAKADVFGRPAHPYTRALLASTPSLTAAQRRARAPVRGELPSPLDPPPGCAFHKRCPHAVPRCATETPVLETFGTVKVACHRVAELNP